MHPPPSPLTLRLPSLLSCPIAALPPYSLLPVLPPPSLPNALLSLFPFPASCPPASPLIPLLLSTSLFFYISTSSSLFLPSFLLLFFLFLLLLLQPWPSTWPLLISFSSVSSLPCSFALCSPAGVLTVFSVSDLVFVGKAFASALVSRRRRKRTPSAGGRRIEFAGRLVLFCF